MQGLDIFRVGTVRVPITSSSTKKSFGNHTSLRSEDLAVQSNHTYRFKRAFVLVYTFLRGKASMKLELAD